MRLLRSGLSHLAPGSPHHPPLNPSAENARQQLAHELAKSQYAALRPNPLNQWIQNFVNWLNSLFDHTGKPAAVGPVPFNLIIVLVVVAAIVVAFLVFGLPRLNRRSRVTGALFGDDDDRDSDALRRAGEKAAAEGDFALAIEELFRSIARGLAERTIMTTFPGTTAHSFAIQAAGAFPDLRSELSSAANAFDAVRYLGAPGTEADWLALSKLEARLRATKPKLDPVDA